MSCPDILKRVIRLSSLGDPEQPTSIALPLENKTKAPEVRSESNLTATDPSIHLSIHPSISPSHPSPKTNPKVMDVTKPSSPTSVLKEETEEDLYTKLKGLQRELEFVEIQEEYVKDEQKNLKIELLRAQEEVKRIQAVPLVIGQFLEMVDENAGIVSSTTGSNYYVRILSTLNRELLKPSSSVALHRHSNALVDILPPEADSSISLLSDAERHDVKYSDVGGMDVQKQEIREAVELPLTHFDLYRQIGSDPPRG
ncbi:hypothetical protein N9L76_08865, partial [bacterium]|nr:hypothetical protein [bacterium]